MWQHPIRKFCTAQRIMTVASPLQGRRPQTQNRWLAKAGSGCGEQLFGLLLLLLPRWSPSLSVQTPSAAQTANRGRKKRAKTFLPPRSLARSAAVRPSVRLAFFLPDYDDDDDEGGGGGGGGVDAL